MEHVSHGNLGTAYDANLPSTLLSIIYYPNFMVAKYYKTKCIIPYICVYGLFSCSYDSNS